MTAHNAIRMALAQVFAAEWDMLPRELQALIVRDCVDDGGVSDFGQYRNNIGRGNLYAYARVMASRFAVTH
jgi:hypothetical protein